MTTLFWHVCRCETAKIADLPGNLLEFHGKKEKISLHKKEDLKAYTEAEYASLTIE